MNTKRYKTSVKHRSRLIYKDVFMRVTELFLCTFSFICDIYMSTYLNVYAGTFKAVITACRICQVGFPEFT